MAGLELLFSSVQQDIRSREDSIVCCLHWFLVTQGFKCIGCGEEAPTSSDNVRRSEKLPANWCSSDGIYSLLYWPKNSRQTHILKAIAVDGELLVHLAMRTVFQRVGDERVANMTVKTTKYTTGNFESFDSAYKNIEEFQELFQHEILDDLDPKQGTSTTASGSQSRSSQGSSSSQNEPDDPLRIPPRHSQRHPPSMDPFAVGRGDLDPLAGGIGGGMLMDPRQGAFPDPGRGLDPSAGLPGRLPRGAVPPGARFDPFGPPDFDRHGNPRGGRAGPDPDHLPPPGYDDMFM